MRKHRASEWFLRTASVVAAAMLIVSCAPKKEAQEERVEPPHEEVEAPPATPSPGMPAGEFSVDGTVLKLPVEGSCWVIRTLEGTEYEPTNLKDEYRIEGTRVRALLRPRSDMASACMVGTVVEIATIEMME